MSAAMRWDKIAPSPTFFSGTATIPVILVRPTCSDTSPWNTITTWDKHWQGSITRTPGYQVLEAMDWQLLSYRPPYSSRDCSYITSTRMLDKIIHTNCTANFNCLLRQIRGCIRRRSRDDPTWILVLSCAALDSQGAVFLQSPPAHQASSAGLSIHDARRRYRHGRHLTRPRSLIRAPSDRDGSAKHASFDRKSRHTVPSNASSHRGRTLPWMRLGVALLRTQTGRTTWEVSYSGPKSEPPGRRGTKSKEPQNRVSDVGKNRTPPERKTRTCILPSAEPE